MLFIWVYWIVAASPTDGELQRAEPASGSLTKVVPAIWCFARGFALQMPLEELWV